MNCQVKLIKKTTMVNHSLHVLVFTLFLLCCSSKAMGSIFSVWTRIPEATCKKPKVILITGASSGIGKELALTMARRGHIVYGAARRVEKMMELEQAGGIPLKLDVTNATLLQEAVDKIIQEQGKMDVLVNNAGMDFYASVEDSPLQATRHLFDVNFFGILDLTQRVLPHMRKAKSGLIVNMSSICGKLHSAFESSYVASKHALEGWSDCLRVETALFNVQVVILEPGYIKSDIHEGSVDYTPADSFYKELSGACYLHTIGPCQESAHDPSVVAKALIHAVESGQPRRRYVMGYMGRYIAIRKWLGDRVYDHFIRSGLNDLLKTSRA